MADKIALAGMERMLKEQGAIRVSEEAKIEFKNVLEEIGEDIAIKAIRLSQHAGRKTIKKNDIRLAFRRVGI